MELKKVLMWMFVAVIVGVTTSLDINSIGDYIDAIAAGQTTPCIEKLLPCQDYFMAPPQPSGPPASPPPQCCQPLKKIVVEDVQCLCQVFENPLFSMSLNISVEDILKLPNACGVNVDASVCKNVAASAPKSSETTPSITTTATSDDSNSSSSSSSNNSTDDLTKSNAAAANEVSYFAGSSLVSLLMAFIILIN